MSFQDIGAVYQLLNEHHAERLSEDFGGGGGNAQVVLHVRIIASDAQALQAAATNATSGRVTSTTLH